MKNVLKRILINVTYEKERKEGVKNKVVFLGD